MDNERKLATNIFKKFFKFKFDKQIQLHLFEYSKNNKNFYIDKLKYIFELINPKSLNFYVKLLHISSSQSYCNVPLRKVYSHLFY